MTSLPPDNEDLTPRNDADSPAGDGGQAATGETQAPETPETPQEAEIPQDSAAPEAPAAPESPAAAEIPETPEAPAPPRYAPPVSGAAPAYAPPTGAPQDPTAAFPAPTGAPVPPAGAPVPPAFTPPQPGAQPGMVPPPGLQSQPAPQAPPQPGYPQPAYLAGQSKPPMNVFAIIGFIGVFFIGIAGIIFGHVSLSQIKRTGEGGRGLALAATIIGYVRVGLTALGVILFMTIFGIFAGSATAAWQDAQDYDFDSDYDYSTEWEGPWVGTEQEVFCEALEDTDLLAMDTEQYYENLIEVTDDAEFKKLTEGQLSRVGTDTNEQDLDSFAKDTEENSAWWSKRSELSDACWGF